jgi:hypothetical protein
LDAWLHSGLGNVDRDVLCAADIGRDEELLVCFGFERPTKGPTLGRGKERERRWTDLPPGAAIAVERIASLETPAKSSIVLEHEVDRVEFARQMIDT